MQHYVVKEKNNNNFILHKKDEFHLTTVMRSKVNSKIICIYKKKHFLTKIIQLKPNLLLEIIEELNINNENDFTINLVIGLMKKTKWDFILQKATELGVNKIIPFNFKSSIIKIDKTDSLKKLTRWNNICKEASEQSERNDIPSVEPILNDINDLKKYLSDFNLLCYARSKNQNIKKILSSIQNEKNKKNLTIVIGPEGGINPDEVHSLNKIGFDVINITRRILRSETAVIYMLSLINYELGSK